MKRAISVILFLCLVSPLWLTYVAFHLRRSQLRHEIEEKLEEGIEGSELVVVALSKESAADDLEWEHAGEFRYKGQFYDVLQIREEQDSVFYTCFWDKEETRLTDYFENALEDGFAKNGREDGDTDGLAQLLKSPFKPNYFNWNSSLKASEAKKNAYAEEAYQSATFSPPSPPPKKLV